MLIKVNTTNIKKQKSKKLKLSSFLLCGLLSTNLLTGCNRTVFDTKYGFDKALILGDDTSIIANVINWKDYEGEQLQFVTSDGLIILSSSFDTNCFYGSSTNYSIEKVAKNAISSEEEIYTIGEEQEKTTFNLDLLDTNWKFNKSITFNGNNALILPVAEWKDYEGEQLQIITPDGLIANLCSYNSKLINDEFSNTKAQDFASYYVGNDGNVTDLSTNVKINGAFNKDIIDTKLGFNKAIIIKDNSVLILPISKWCDYEGEQLQLQIENGPLVVTAAYDTILINDISSTTKALDIAKSLSSNVIDLSADYTYDSPIIYNGTIIDLNYGFTNGIISNDNSATALKINKWCDYEGEQLQIELPNGDVILTSSIFLDLLNGGTSSLNATSLAGDYINENGKLIDKSNGNYESSVYNTYLLDTELKFQYALKVINGNVTIIPLKKWQDFANTDGNKDKENSPNCEQLQLILPDKTAIVTTAYDTILVKTDNIMDIAELFRGAEGVINDLTSYVGQPDVSGWNISLFDTKYYFSYAIFNNDSSTQIFPISKWRDYSEGEQLQLQFSDNTGFLTSFVNTTLVDPQTENIENIIAASFSGQLQENNKLVKKYN